MDSTTAPGDLKMAVLKVAPLALLLLLAAVVPSQSKRKPQRGIPNRLDELSAAPGHQVVSQITNSNKDRRVSFK